jgi:hypothetical protein
LKSQETNVNTKPTSHRTSFASQRVFNSKRRLIALLTFFVAAVVAFAVIVAAQTGGVSFKGKGSKRTGRAKIGFSKDSIQSIASANFVYHEQTSNYVATPQCNDGSTNTACGRYVENTDRSGASGFQIFSPETYTLHFKIEFQFFTNQVRVYYTTDGSTPCGSFGTVGNVTQPNNTPCGAGNTTQVSVANYTCTYADQTQSCQVVEVATGTIPPQPAGTTVKYIVSAWHSGGGPEVFGNSGTCGGCFSATNSSDATVFQYNVIAPPATPLIISEFRLRGPGGANDEFVEIYNNGDTDVTVNAFDGSSGFSVAASDTIARFTIPNGTVIPARGHYLGVNSTAYSLTAYPADSSTTATGDATYTTDIPDNKGIALFNTANPANFTMGNRLDAVGSTAETDPIYKEGGGYPALSVVNVTGVDYSLYRDLSSGLPKDTNDNEKDFRLVDTNGNSGLCVPTANFECQRLGAPGPENLSSPIQRNAFIKASLIFPCMSSSSSPNRVRDPTPDANTSHHSAFGTLSIRRRFTNNTGSSVTRLRFRIVNMTTFPSGTLADLRAITSSDVGVTAGNNPCGTGVLTIKGTKLETPPAQPNGGALNSTLSADSVALSSPLAPNATIDIQFLLGVEETGSFRFFINIEALP